MSWLTDVAVSPHGLLVGFSACLLLLLALVLHLSRRLNVLSGRVEQQQGVLGQNAGRLEDLETFRRVFDPTHLKTRDEDLVGLLETLLGASELLQSEQRNGAAHATSGVVGKESVS